MSECKPAKSERSIASEKLGVPGDELDYFAWEQTFPSTSGPFGGYGGQMVTRMVVEAYAHPFKRNAMLFCCGRPWRLIKEFDPVTAVTKGYR